MKIVFILFYFFSTNIFLYYLLFVLKTYAFLSAKFIFFFLLWQNKMKSLTLNISIIFLVPFMNDYSNHIFFFKLTLSFLCQNSYTVSFFLFCLFLFKFTHNNNFSWHKRVKFAVSYSIHLISSLVATKQFHAEFPIQRNNNNKLFFYSILRQKKKKQKNVIN